MSQLKLVLKSPEDLPVRVIGYIQEVTAADSPSQKFTASGFFPVWLGKRDTMKTKKMSFLKTFQIIFCQILSYNFLHNYDRFHCKSHSEQQQPPSTLQTLSQNMTLDQRKATRWKEVLHDIFSVVRVPVHNRDTDFRVKLVLLVLQNLFYSIRYFTTSAF